MTTVVDLTDQDARDFIEFQKKRKFFELLTHYKVFDIRSGSCTIHFSRLGEVVGIQKVEEYTTNVLP